jgi:hypothetical protein
MCPLFSSIQAKVFCTRRHVSSSRVHGQWSYLVYLNKSLPKTNNIFLTFKNVSRVINFTGTKLRTEAAMWLNLSQTTIAISILKLYPFLGYRLHLQFTVFDSLHCVTFNMHSTPKRP